jgi:hypothetical protein
MIRWQTGLAVSFLIIMYITIGCSRAIKPDWAKIQKQLDHGEFDAANEQVENIIASDSLSASSLYGKALINEYQDYLWDAHIQCFKAFQVDSTFSPAIRKFIDLSLILNTQYLAEHAVKLFISNRPNDPDGYLIKARIDMEMDRFDSARTALDKAASLKADPVDLTLYNTELELRSYDSSRITPALEQLDKIKPVNDRQKLHLARLYKYMNFDGYRDVLIAGDDNMKICSRLADYLVDDYYCSEALEISQSLLERDSSYGSAYLIAANVHGILNEDYSADQVLYKFLAVNPSSPYGYHQRAEYSAKYGDPIKAMDEYDLVFNTAINQKYPKDYLYRLFLELMDVSFRANDIYMLMEHVAKGEFLDTGDDISEVLRATIMLQFDDTKDSARVLVDQKIEKNKGNRTWLEKAAWHYLFTQRPDSSEILYHLLLEMSQPREDYFMSLLDIYKVTKRIESADNLAKIIPWRFHNSRRLLEKFYNFYNQTEQLDKEFEYAQKLYRKSSGFLLYAKNLAWLHKAHNHNDAGLEILRQYCDNYPSNLQARYEYGLYAMEIGRPELALDCSHYIIEADSTFGGGPELQGLYFYHNNQIDSAMHYFRKVVDLAWPTPYSYYYLGEYLLQKEENLIPAAGLGMAAIRYFKKDRRGYSLLGRIYMTQGKYRLAKSILNSGVRVFPEDAELNYFLGSAYYQIGENENADKYLKLSLKYEDHKLTDSQRREAQEILSQI